MIDRVEYRERLHHYTYTSRREGDNWSMRDGLLCRKHMQADYSGNMLANPPYGARPGPPMSVFLGRLDEARDTRSLPIEDATVTVVS